MIAHLSGTVRELGVTSAVFDLGGFGLKVQLTPQTAGKLQLGQVARVATALIVREDSLTLFGFADDNERDCFNLLLTASGIGPRIAQAVLSVLQPAELAAAIARDDIAALIRVPGIGRKGAERIMIELRDKIAGLQLAEPSDATAAFPAGAWREQVTQGLQGLGWTTRDADTAIERISHLVAEDPQVEVSVLMRAALQSLARNR